MVTSEEMSEIVGGNVKEKLSSVPESLTDILDIRKGQAYLQMKTITPSTVHTAG